MMMKDILKRIVLVAILFFFWSTVSVLAQITVSPSNPTTEDTLTLIYDAGKGNKGLYGLNENIYLHSGAITSSSRDGGDWKFVVGNWGQDDPQVKMEILGGDKYAFTFHPKSFYNLPEGTQVNQLAFVFRNEKGNKVGKTASEEDILIPVNGYKPPVKEAAKYDLKERKLLDYSQHDQMLDLFTDHGTIRLKVFNDEVVQAIYFSDGKIRNEKSHAVIMDPENVGINFVENDTSLFLETNGIAVQINKSPLSISYYYQNEIISQEELGFFERSDNNGVRLKLQKSESIYGTGERAIPMDVRNNYLELYNRPDYNYGLNAKNLNYTIPLVVSSEKYMVLFDNPQKGYLDIGYTDNDILEFGAIGGLMNYYIIASESFPGLLNEYTSLTGKQPLPPRWALGNLQSRMAYRTQEETESIVEAMQKERFPIDAIILDFYWFGDSIKGFLGNLDWYKPNWPQPKKMIQDFREKGVKTILITEPFIIDTAKWFKYCDENGLLTTDSQGRTFVNKEFYFGNGGLIDIFKPEAGDWFWEQYDKQEKNGVEGWWGDLGEPESHPNTQRHVNGWADEVHNIYAHYWEKMLFEKYKMHYPKKRLFHLNRSGYAGSQRFSVFPWTGDVSRSWSGLQAQLPILLNMSMCGLGYIHSDAGGFAMGEMDDELYTRWLQFACFSPILRPHGSGIPSEPIFFSEKTKDIVRDFMLLRYQLMPYIYNMAFQNSISGKPLMMPLYFNHPDDERFRNYSDVYYFGDQLLVAPIVKPNQKAIKVQLPKGKWFDFWNDQMYQGDREYSIEVTLEQIPVFVKSGSIIPKVSKHYSTDDYPNEILNIHYWPDSVESNYSFYEDDGKTNGAYNEGEYNLTDFKGFSSIEETTFTVSKIHKWDSIDNGKRTLKIYIHNIEQMPEEILVNKKVYRVYNKMMKVVSKEDHAYWDEQNKQIIIGFQWDMDEIKIEF